MIELARKALMGIAYACMGGALFGCPGPGPGPTPTPTPTVLPTPVLPAKGVPVSPEMLLRQTNARLHTLDNKAFEAFMALPCCNTPPPQVTNSGWPLASIEYMNFTREYGANMFHFRMGPFYADDDHEVEWKEWGGPFIGSGPDFNEKFWTQVRENAYYALKFGAYVEVNLIDTWYCKHAASNWGDQQMPWPQEDIDKCGIEWTPTHERYIRKSVEELGCFGNVIWLTDNEGNNINGTQRKWYTDQVAAIRRAEEELGCNFVHMIGTNSGFNDVADYVAVHDRAPLTGPVDGRWTINNERNPELAPAVEQEYFRQAREAGQAWAFWVAGMDVDTQIDVLSRFRNVVQGGGVVQCFPPPDGDLWGQPIEAANRACQRCDVVNQAKAKMADPCGQDPSASLERFAQTVRDMGYCAGKMSDSVFILAPDQLWEEHHVIAYTTGCYSLTSNGYKAAWPYNGTNPTPPPLVSCTDPVPTYEQLKYKTPGQHNQWYDTTALQSSACDYCAAIGMGEMGDGSTRCECPTRSECPGYKCEERVACESKFNPQWNCSNGPAEVKSDNPYMARCGDGSSYIEACAPDGTKCQRTNL